MYSVLKKVLEYRSPLYRSTGTRFKKLFLSIVFTILKKSYFLNIQPVHLGFVCDLSQTKKKPSLQRYFGKLKLRGFLCHVEIKEIVILLVNLPHADRSERLWEFEGTHTHYMYLSFRVLKRNMAILL